jgi:hypothetical protein
VLQFQTAFQAPDSVDGGRRGAGRGQRRLNAWRHWHGNSDARWYNNCIPPTLGRRRRSPKGSGRLEQDLKSLIFISVSIVMPFCEGLVSLLFAECIKFLKVMLRLSVNSHVWSPKQATLSVMIKFGKGMCNWRSHRILNLIHIGARKSCIEFKPNFMKIPAPRQHKDLRKVHKFRFNHFLIRRTFKNTLKRN